MTTAPDTSTIPDEDDETPPTPSELLTELGQLHTRAMASPHPANPEAMGWQMIAASAVAGFARALHALNEQDPTAAARIAAVYHGPLGEGPNPQAHSAWLERFIAGPETFRQWVDEGRQAAAEAALHTMTSKETQA